MTGNTAGPHVCYRFWKNGEQVDPLKQKFPNSEPMAKTKVPAYNKFIEPLKIQLDSIEYPKDNSIFHIFIFLIFIFLILEHNKRC